MQTRYKAGLTAIGKSVSRGISIVELGREMGTVVNRSSVVLSSQAVSCCRPGARSVRSSRRPWTSPSALHPGAILVGSGAFLSCDLGSGRYARAYEGEGSPGSASAELGLCRLGLGPGASDHSGASAQEGSSTSYSPAQGSRILPGRITGKAMLTQAERWVEEFLEGSRMI